MARTYRNLEGMNRCALRRPRTSNERRQILALIHDVKTEDYEISGLNHLHHRLANCPTAWDDQVISGYYQQDYKAS